MAFWRTWLYHRDCLKGKIFDFETEAEAKEMMAAGWKDSPGKCEEGIPQVEGGAVGATIVGTAAMSTPKKPRAPGRPPKKVKGGK